MNGRKLAVTGAALWADRAAARLADQLRRELGGVRREEPAAAATALCARACLAQARLTTGPTVALLLGAGRAIEAVNLAHAGNVLARDPEAVNALTFVYTTPNAIAGRVASLLGLTGESLTLPDPAAPFWAAADLLASGRAQAALVGGVCVRQTARAGELAGAAALLCLEPEDAARERGAPVRGTLAFETSQTPPAISAEDEASIAAALVRQLAAGENALVECGRRGALALAPLPLPAAGETVP